MVAPFANAPHGTQVEDALAPAAATAGAGLAGVFIGYPEKVTVEAAEGTHVWATSDIVITNGAPVLAASPTWIQLGVVGNPGFLRLPRVRYAFMRCTTDEGALTGAVFTVHPGELNVIEDTAATKGLDE